MGASKDKRSARLWIAQLETEKGARKAVAQSERLRARATVRQLAQPQEEDWERPQGQDWGPAKDRKWAEAKAVS